MVNNSRGGGGESRMEGSSIGANRERMRKGPWTAAEDAILVEYVRSHGEGNWNAVQKNTGLNRCGKSCRLRWANHLRPNLKKGSFSPEEERIILELHAKLGNKWARMAAQLPGRTDNEIKNFWNTRMKRRLRAGLPLYPHDVQQDAAAFHLQQQPHFHNQQQSASSSSSSFPPLLSHNNNSQSPSFDPSLPIFDPIMSFASSLNSLQNRNHDPALYHNNACYGGFLLPQPAISSLGSSSSSAQFTQNLGSNMNYGSCGFGSGFRSVTNGAPYEQALLGLETELPSIQTPPNSTTPASSGATNENIEMAAQTSRENGGFLEALVDEAQAMGQQEISKNKRSSAMASGKGKEEAKKGRRNSEEEDAPLATFSAQKQLPTDLVPSHLSNGITQKAGQIMEEMDSIDEDLMSLLNSFPTAAPLPEWYPSSSSVGVGVGVGVGFGVGGGGSSDGNGYSMPSTGTSLAVEGQQTIASLAPVASPVASQTVDQIMSAASGKA